MCQPHHLLADLVDRHTFHGPHGLDENDSRSIVFAVLFAILFAVLGGLLLKEPICEMIFNTVPDELDQPVAIFLAHTLAVCRFLKAKKEGAIDMPYEIRRAEAIEADLIEGLRQDSVDSVSCGLHLVEFECCYFMAPREVCRFFPC